MKHFIMILAIALVGCATTVPVQTGKDTYMVSARVPFSGESGALQQALSDGSAFCQAQGKHLKLISNSTHECALHGGCGEAQVIFACE